MDYLAKDIMNRDVISVRSDMDLRDLGKLFLDKGITGAPVVERDGTLAGVISQRLARRVCPHCREQRAATEAEKKLLRVDLSREIGVWEGKGCPKCAGFGMKGRRVVYELLVMDEDLSEAVARDAELSDIRRIADSAGFVPIRDHARELVLEGEIPVAAMSRIVA